MSTRPCAISFSITILMLECVAPVSLAEKPKEPLWTHAFDLAARKYGEAVFDEKTKRYGVEVFKDRNVGYGVYVSEIGAVAVAAGFDKITAPIMNGARPKFLAGLDLPVRKAGEKELTKDTKVYALEIFKDLSTKNWTYVTENGELCATPGRAGFAIPTSPRSPTWTHSVDLSVRIGGATDWKDAKKFGIEVYFDNNTGNLIYVCDNGSIAVIPGPATVPPKQSKAPSWLYGLGLKCRKSTEESFTKESCNFGIEVFRDENNGNLIYLCETGAIAVVPGMNGLSAPTKAVKNPRFSHGLNLKCRKFGERDFTDKTQTFGCEVFHDPNTNVTIYVNERGRLAAISKN